MADFDVIVIGAGPAGGYAALTAAREGCRVALFEEHGAIGVPRHDPGWLMECEFAASVVGALGQKVPWTRVKEFRLCNAESGEILERSTLGGYLLRRDLLEKEVAALAVQARATLFIKTKVVDLLRKEGKVVGVETNSNIIPTVNGQIVICADGIRSAGHGFASKEGLCGRSEMRPGLSYILANADVSEGVIENFLSPDPLLDYRCFWPHSKSICYLGLSVTLELNKLRERQDNVISHKVRAAYPLEISGYGRAASGKRGQYFQKMVKDNIMFIGDASGGGGNIHAMIQGQFAGTVAAAAIKDADISENRFEEYQDSVLKTLVKAPFCWYSAREDFGSFDNWFREFREATKGIKAKELLD